MARIIKLTESDLEKIIKKVLNFNETATKNIYLSEQVITNYDSKYDYKKENDDYFFKLKNSDNWSKSVGTAMNAIKTKVFKDKTTNDNTYKPIGFDVRKDIQSYNDQHGRQPSQTVWGIGETLTLGSNLFDTGKSTINKTSTEFQTALTALKSLTPQTKVDVLGGASAVGSTQGYDNNALALRRANNMIKALKESGVTNINFIAKGIVGTNVQLNSPGAKAEQFVKLTRITAPPIAQSRPAIDNTQNVANIPRNLLLKPNPNQGTLRRVSGVNASTPLR
jgi:outer membrane protein OmpA-like peptidoglycan-associated protein